MAKSPSVQVTVHYVDGLSRTAAAVHSRVASMASQDLGMIEPNITIREWGHGIRIEIACHNTDPAGIRLLMSSTALLFFAPQKSQRGVHWLFRYVRVEASLDVTDASAEIENGVLRIYATHWN